MNRIDRRFRDLAAAGRCALVPYITAGHPQPPATVGVMHELAAAGADLLELGIPFSDVMADGPVIQNACRRALEQGVQLDDVLAMVAEFRRTDSATPVILMGYMNPLERRGMETFAGQAGDAGVDGVLIVDCPSDEAADSRRLLGAAGLHQIFLVAPTTTPARMERTAALAGGFIYYVSLKGVTGAASLKPGDIVPAVERIRSWSELPVAVGFGIGTPEQAAAVAQAADGVVIGSALVDRLDGAQNPDRAAAVAREFVAPIRAAMDDARKPDSTPGSKDNKVANA